MIDVRKLRELVELMVANDLTELDIQGKDDRVTLKRASDSPTVQYVSPPPGAVQVAAGAPPGQAGDAPAGSKADAAATDSDEHATTIPSPMVGTFYAAPSPDAEPFISVGDTVQEDTVVCIVEAMKVFNEIKAETSGVITKILVETGQAVEFDQPLFEIKPG